MRLNSVLDFKGSISPPPRNQRKSKIWIFVGLFLYFEDLQLKIMNFRLCLNYFLGNQDI
ncbi:hypothetical protein B0H39_000192 [Clostridium beijerinckii]|nr:hypothetical protein [Clostridium beijerinckii]NOV69130.1 hypothetical protein [Clostridium beijerinckii]NOW32758.1 hypothetical protein [Clostridium beijerinckii]NOW82311.1 hypothetical protein [Clostridium beijerinckii]